MTDSRSVLVSVVAGLVVLLLTFFAGRTSTLLKSRRRIGYIHDWLDGSRGIIIVLPNFGPYRSGNNMITRLPANVLMMPAAEGAAVARLVMGLHQVRRGLDIHFHFGESYPMNPHRLPVITIGGPSVNGVARELIEGRSADIRMAYPEHEATVKGRILKPEERDDLITEDYGFVVAGMAHGAPYAMMFGVYSPGTWAAVQTFLKLEEKDYKKKLGAHQPVLLTAHTEVDGYGLDVSKVSLMPWSCC